MKLFLLSCLFCQLLFSPIAQAQTVILGDSVYQGLESGKSSLSDIFRIVGHPSSREKLWRYYHAHLRSGSDISEKSISGYRFSYRKLDLSFILDEHKQRISGIHFGPKASVVTAKGIQPTKSTFQDVMNAYGDIDPTNDDGSKPMIRLRSTNPEKTAWYTWVRYKNITFVSHGKWKQKEDLVSKQVDEIWLR